MGSAEYPEYWAIRAEHPDREQKSRQWQIDIGISCISPFRYKFNCTVSHRLIDNFIGDEPPLPDPTTPKLVSYLLRSTIWKAEEGHTELTSEPEEVEVGYATPLIDALRDLQRRVPIVMISAKKGDDPHVDAKRLAKNLAGVAHVYFATNTDVGDEIEHHLKNEFRCRDGMVRVYQPGMQTNRPETAHRHRYFTAIDIQEKTPKVIEQMIVAGVVRRRKFADEEYASSIEDVDAQSNRLRLSELRKLVSSAAEKDSKIAEKDNDLLKFLEEYEALDIEKRQMKKEIDDLDEMLESLQDSKEELEGEVGRLKYEVGTNLERAVAAEKSSSELERQIATFKGFEKLPENLYEVANLVEEFHAGKVVFTDKAIASTRDADFQDVNEAWKCLWAVATTLHELHSADTVASIADEFRRLTSFELSMTEGKQTKNDAGIMASRKTEWNGKEIDITPHIKAEKSKRFLRIHYAFLPDEGKIIIGHCGNHLNTAGTRKNK